MNGIIIYQGKYGATEQYAKWLAESLDLPKLKATDAASPVLTKQDFIILGSSIYIGKLVLQRWLKQNSSLLAGKKIFLFVVCGTTAEDSIQQQAVIKNNVEEELAKNCEFFFLPGRVIVSRLTWKDRFMLKIGAMLEKDPKKKAVMNKGFDGMDQKHLSSLMKSIQSFLKPALIPLTN